MDKDVFWSHILSHIWQKLKLFLPQWNFYYVLLKKKAWWKFWFQCMTYNSLTWKFMYYVHSTVPPIKQGFGFWKQIKYLQVLFLIWLLTIVVSSNTVILNKMCLCSHMLDPHKQGNPISKWLHILKWLICSTEEEFLSSYKPAANSNWCW